MTPPSRSASSEPSNPESPSPSEKPPSPPESSLFLPPTSQPDTSSQEPPSWESPDAHPSDDPAADSGSPRRSTGSAARARLRELRATVETAVLTAGGIAAALLTREGSPERDAGLWLPDDDDVEAISDPLASLASRRLPEGAENPDLTDLVRLGFGLLGYAIKQRAKRAALVVYLEPDEFEQEEPAA